jgi:hypothetical protein
MSISKKRLAFVILGVVLIVFAVFFVYRILFDTFFTQDEWWELGRAVDARTQGIGYYFKPWGGHVVPLMLLCLNLQFAIFGTNIWPYAFLALLGHSLIALTLCFFVSSLTGRLLIGVLSGLIFAVNTAPFHAVTYIAGGVTHIHGATILFLVSLILFAQYIKSGYLKKYLYLSLASIILALGFMEYVAFYFFLVPICYLFFQQGRKKKEIIKDLVVILLVGTVFFAFRVFTQKIHIYGSQFIGMRTVEDPSIKMKHALFEYARAVFLNTAKLLPRSLYQVWMNENMMSVASFFRSFDAFTFTMFGLVLGAIITTIIILRRLKEYLLSKVVFVATLVVVLGAFPAYVFPTFPNIIESRYLYSPSLGFSVLFAIFIVSLAEVSARISKRIRVAFITYPLIIAVFLMPFFIQNYKHIDKRLRDTVVISRMRQKILKQALNYYPHIGPKSVFYAITNLVYPGIPWPVSLGYTFLVMHTYQGDYKGAEKFFRSNNLWPVNQGYEDFGDIGFGLFYEFMPMLDTVKKYGISEDNIYGFYWEATLDGKRNLNVTHASPAIYDGELRDITPEVRGLVKEALLKDDYAALKKEVEKYFSDQVEFSFDRPSKGTFIDASGLVKTAGYGLPRLTTGGIGSIAGVLIEGYSANLLLYSQEFDNPVWKKSEGLEILKDEETSPEGEQNAYKAVFATAQSALEQKVNYPITGPDATRYVFSIFVKGAAGGKADLVITDAKGRKEVSEVELSDKWQRFSVAATTLAGGPLTVGVTNAMGQVYLWGAQLEDYSYPSSYIRTKDKVEFRGGDIFRVSTKKPMPMYKGTISFWVKADWDLESALSHMLFYNGEDPNRDCVGIEASPQLLRFKIMDSKAAHKYMDYYWDFKEIKKQGWNYIASAWGDGQMQLYLNGQPVGQPAGPGTGIVKDGLNFNAPHRIGVHHGWFSMYADAAISNFKQYDRSLSPEEIKAIFESQEQGYRNPQETQESVLENAQGDNIEGMAENIPKNQIENTAENIDAAGSAR